MTVKELIKKLIETPMDAEVSFIGDLTKETIRELDNNKDKVAFVSDDFFVRYGKYSVVIDLQEMHPAPLNKEN